jgi:hypothetical protein
VEFGGRVSCPEVASRKEMVQLANFTSIGGCGGLLRVRLRIVVLWR